MIGNSQETNYQRLNLKILILNYQHQSEENHLLQDMGIILLLHPQQPLQLQQALKQQLDLLLKLMSMMLLDKGNFQDRLQDRITINRIYIEIQSIVILLALALGNTISFMILMFLLRRELKEKDYYRDRQGTREQIHIGRLR